MEQRLSEPDLRVLYPAHCAQVTRDYTWGLDLAGLQSGRWDQESGSIGGLLAVTEVTGTATNIFLPLCDHIGTIHGLVAAVTNNLTLPAPLLAETRTYSPYGELIEVNFTLQPSAFSLQPCPFGFQSKYHDAETGFWYYGYRFFDSRSGKWLTTDPIQEAGGLNLTEFCGGDPVNKVDPLGLTNQPGDFGWVSYTASYDLRPELEIRQEVLEFLEAGIPLCGKTTGIACFSSSEVMGLQPLPGYQIDTGHDAHTALRIMSQIELLQCRAALRLTNVTPTVHTAAALAELEDQRRTLGADLHEYLVITGNVNTDTHQMSSLLCLRDLTADELRARNEERARRYIEAHPVRGLQAADIDPVDLFFGIAAARAATTASCRLAAKTEAHVFWSGGRRAENAARTFAGANDGIILGDTAAGKALSQSTAGLPWSQARPQWLSLSEDFARTASGEVDVFHVSDGVFLDSIWRDEYRVLLQNPNVTKINFRVVMPDGSVVLAP